MKVLSTNEYYSLQTADGAVHHVKNARDVARIFPEQKGQIKQMAKQRHLSFSKKEREQSLVKVVEGVSGAKLFTVDSLSSCVPVVAVQMITLTGLMMGLPANQL